MTYKSPEEFLKSESELLNCVPELSSITKGSMNFYFDHNGKKYYLSGSHCYVSDYEYEVGEKVNSLLWFDNFWLCECMPDKKLREICNW